MTAGTTSTIINTSGVRKYFDFLPPAGGYMEPDEERTGFGDVYDWIRQGTAQQAAFRYCLDPAQGFIQIKNSPAMVAFDESLEQIRQITLDNDEVVVELPEFITTTTTTTTTTAAPTTTTTTTTTTAAP